MRSGALPLCGSLYHPLSSLRADLLRQVKPLANDAYTKVRHLLLHADPDLRTLRGLMCPAMNAGSGDVQWVKVECAEAWRQARFSVSRTGEGMGSHGEVCGIGKDSEYVHTSAVNMTCSSTVSDVNATTTTTTASVAQETICTVPYDPWVVIAHPAVSAADCGDVNAMTEWLHNGEAHLRASIAERLSVALVLDNCAHITRLAHRLAANKHYLSQVAGDFLSSEDEEDVVHAVEVYMSSQHMPSGGSGAGRSWCSIS